MAFGWLALLKGVPWAGVISTAPLVADGAKQLWKAVSKQPPSQAPSSLKTNPPHTSGSAAIEALEVRVAALEAGATDLHTQMLKSSELIKVLADQNAQLVKHVEANRVRTLWLTSATIVAAIAALASLAVAFIHWDV